MIGTPSFAPGTLLAVAADRMRAARAAGALQPIPTHRRVIADGGVRFLVHEMASLVTKEAERVRRQARTRTGAAPANPFLPYDEALFVADLTTTHLCLLNKFSVIDRHLLIVTRTFEEQETPLTRADMEALALCLGEINGLGFFNGGTAAGASQPHKHLQLVPLPLAPDGPRVPMEPLLADALAAAPGEPGIAGTLPFRHGLCRLEGCAVAELVRAYRALLAATGMVSTVSGFDDGEPLPPYNLLVTRTWMLLVPRTREQVEGISLNALGYAGSLFVRDAAGLARVEAFGPMRMLRAATQPLA